MSEVETESLELEVAVVRGQSWVYRGVFFPPAMVSVGSSPSAALSLPETDLPEYHELIRIYSDGGVLFFKPGMAVELRMKEGTKSNAELLEEGLATIGGAGWKVPLGLGSKGAFRVADVAVLFKVRKRGPHQVQSVVAGDPTLCGTCNAPLQFEVVGFGGLTPCVACRALNEVQSPSSHDPLGRETLVQPVVKSSAELPTFDAISVLKFNDPTKPKGLEPLERVSRERLSKLPTFDAISVLSSDAGPVGPVALKEKTGLPIHRLTQLADRAPSKPAKKVTYSVRGADLPTFDAISVLKEDAILSTESAIDLLRGASAGEPPVASFVSQVEMDPVQATMSPDGAASTLEELDEFFGGGDVSIDLQRSYNAIPVLSRLTQAEQIAPGDEGDEKPSSERFAEKETRQVAIPKWMANQAETIETKSPSDLLNRSADSGPAEGGPRHGIQNTGDQDGDDADDFLMGRTELSGQTARGAKSRWLVTLGGLAGVVGLLLILYRLFS